jgi:hypothetical protein
VVAGHGVPARPVVGEQQLEWLVDRSHTGLYLVDKVDADEEVDVLGAAAAPFSVDSSDPEELTRMAPDRRGRVRGRPW